MAKIQINNPRQIINGGAKKYYFKVKGLGGPKGDKGDTGATGPQGHQGPQGNAATVSVGSTTTLPVGYDATVTNSGSIYNAVLDFGIPQGPQGPQGAKGDKGDTGAQGETGPRGPQGERGTNATVYVGTTTTTNPGTQARVYNSGTDSNAVLNFEIPRGDVGPMPTIAQTTGQAIDQVMSQKATTDALNTKQNALTAGQGIDITSNVISTPALVPEVVASLPAEGTEGKLYLTPKAHTTSTATGNPITASVTEQAGAIESFQLDGDTFQQSYEGKNLWSNTPYKVGYYIAQDGREAASDNTCIYGNIETSPDTTYTLTLTNLGVSATVRAHAYDENENWIEQIDSLFISTNEKKSMTFVTPANAKYLRWSFWEKSMIADGQIEKGSTATDYEPFVGGQPSPSPDYPQPIQTVTGEQTVEIVGKNLANPTPVPGGSNGVVATYNSQTGVVTVSGIAQTTWSNTFKVGGSIYLPAGTYTLKQYGELTSGRISCYTRGRGYHVDASTLQKTFTTTSDGSAHICITSLTAGNSVSGTIKFQLEAGSTATQFVPYSKQTYPLDLGSIELCKISEGYGDYIWKNGDDWKVHKEVGKAELWKGTNWRRLDTLKDGEHRFSVKVSNTDTPTSASSGTLVHLNSNYWPACTRLQTYQQTQGIAATGASDFSVESFIAFVDSLKTSDVDGWKAWLTTNKPVVYYPSTAPTDTAITDTNLIAQLDAIRTASLENGANTITNTATEPNLAGDMEIGYYGYNPTNRYDKFIWLDLNNAYEQLNNPDTSSTLSTLSTRSLGTTAEQPTVTRSLETETITLKKGEAEPIEDKTGLPTIQDEETEEAETTEPEESDGTDER